MRKTSLGKGLRCIHVATTRFCLHSCADQSSHLETIMNRSLVALVATLAIAPAVSAQDADMSQTATPTKPIVL